MDDDPKADDPTADDSKDYFECKIVSAIPYLNNVKIIKIEIKPYPKEYEPKVKF